MQLAIAVWWFTANPAAADRRLPDLLVLCHTSYSQDMAAFKLSYIIQAHEKDVRCLCPFGEGGFVTGSRDNTGKIFVPSKSGQTFVEAQCLTGAQKYVSCCCVLPSATTGTPDRIYLGSHDHDIHCYTDQESYPIAVLRGHTGPVSALAADPKSGRILSGAWDCTAILWQDNLILKTIIGHSGSILSVAFLGPEYLLTGSADKTIKCWNENAELKETFFGHEDAVRGLLVINEDLFMSCSNDGSLRRWSLSRGLVKTYHCHDQYVYSMAWVRASDKSENEKIGFISCSEDRTAKVFVKGKLAQVIPLPSETLWSIISLSPTEIAIATSSGRVFILTTNATKYADAEQVQLFESLFDMISISTTEKGGRPILDSADLLPQEVDEGERGLVRAGENTNVFMFLREKPVPAEAGGWIKVGFMKGSDAKSMNKNEYEGKLYDYVINVDMEDGQPLLKLPFNVGDDPKEAAIAFVTRHNLPAAYLDTIEQFIISNVVTDGQPK
jgi:phospholipase A-2-activating protein